MPRICICSTLCLSWFSLVSSFSGRGHAPGLIGRLERIHAIEGDRAQNPTGSFFREASEPNDGRLLAMIQLVGCSSLWGTYPTLMRTLYAEPGAHLDPSLVTLLRFTVMAAAAALALALTSNSLSGDSTPTHSPLEVPPNQSSWKDQLSNRAPSSLALCALELGLLGWLGTFLNSTGLETVPPLKAGILLSFINVFTPVISSFAGSTEQDRSVSPRIWVGSLLTLVVSAYALVPDGPDPSDPLSLGTHGISPQEMIQGLNPFQVLSSLKGEWLLLGAALAFSSAKVRLGSQLRVHDPSQLSAARLVAQWIVALAAVAVIDEAGPYLLAAYDQWAHHGGTNSDLSAVVAPAIVQTSLFSTPVIFPVLTARQATLVVGSALASGTTATWLQAKGQNVVPATQAQLIFACTPVFSALWAFFLLHEPITAHEIAGGFGLMVVASITLQQPGTST